MPANSPGSAVTSGSILIVEDDAGIRQMLVLALHERGFETDAVDSMAGARAAVAARRPTFALLDLLLDGANALTLIGELEAARIPVIVMTADRDVEAAVMAAGASGWISKPFDLDEIYTLAERYAEPGA
jgi:DNA-binding NtrC family response regulator